MPTGQATGNDVGLNAFSEAERLPRRVTQQHDRLDAKPGFVTKGEFDVQQLASPLFQLLCRRVRDDVDQVHARVGRAETLDDVCSVDTCDAEVDGDHLNDDELLGFCLLLLVAGHETTTNLLSNSAVVLARHPESRRQLADHSELVPAAVEELLRYDSPVQGLARTLTRPIDLHGQRMNAGDTVLLLFGSANRDDWAFPEADCFNIHRAPERQVAFGRGIHFCLGAALARLEARIALEALLVYRRDWDVDLDSAVRLRSGPIRGYASLLVQ